MIEGAIAPVAVFVVALHFLGVTGAVVAGLGFAYSLVAWRVFTRRKVPALLIIGTVLLTARSALALSTGSVFVYFLQPTLGLTLVAVAFLLSAGTAEPLAGRIACDFCPIPDHVATTVPMRRFFRQITLLWAAAELANAGITLWLLLSQSVGVYVVTRAIASLTLTAFAIMLSVLWFRRSMSRHIVFAPRTVRADRRQTAIRSA
ncbi:MAG TPA: VC0807 family protein [Acidimicrobiia bacterium]|nr:VC0807 family protein [Acidimicrobiia bacterium]